MGKKTPSRRTRANISGMAATRTSAAAKTTRKAARVKPARVQQPMRTMQRINIKSTKQKIYNTKMMCALNRYPPTGPYMGHLVMLFLNLVIAAGVGLAEWFVCSH